MKCITIRQPWAWLIVSGGINNMYGTYEHIPLRCGYKNVENRKWRTSFRGRLLIHAAKTEPEDDELHNAFSRYPTFFAGAKTREYPSWPDYGCIIGSVKMVDCVRDHPSPWAFPNHWHWVLESPRAFHRPIPYRGMPGMFDVPDDLLPEIA